MMARFMRVFKNHAKIYRNPCARKMSPTYPDDEIDPWVNSKKNG